MEDNGPFPDQDLLKCPICVELFTTTPVYQCRNGHMPCSSCYAKNENKCPWCSLPMGNIRCLRKENILESTRRPCENKKYGCKETVNYTQNNEHASSCAFSPCFCPISGCNFEGSSSKLYSHFSRRHASYAQRFRFDEIFTLKLDRTKSLILREDGRGSIFVLNHSNEVNGSCINVVRIAPISAGVLPYGLRARYGEASNILHSSVSSFPKWEANAYLESEYLVIPEYCATSEIHLDVVIRSQPEVLWSLWRRFCFSSL